MLSWSKKLGGNKDIFWTRKDDRKGGEDLEG